VPVTVVVHPGDNTRTVVENLSTVLEVLGYNTRKGSVRIGVNVANNTVAGSGVAARVFNRTEVNPEVSVTELVEDGVGGVLSLDAASVVTVSCNPEDFVALGKPVGNSLEFIRAEWAVRLSEDEDVHVGEGVCCYGVTEVFDAAVAGVDEAVVGAEVGPLHVSNALDYGWGEDFSRVVHCNARGID